MKTAARIFTFASLLALGVGCSAPEDNASIHTANEAQTVPGDCTRETLWVKTRTYAGTSITSADLAGQQCWGFFNNDLRNTLMPLCDTDCANAGGSNAGVGGNLQTNSDGSGFCQGEKNTMDPEGSYGAAGTAIETCYCTIC
jgi:hypothetical protein